MDSASSNRDNENPVKEEVYSFGQFELDATTGELKRNGYVVKLQKQTTQLLIYLVRTFGRTVTREELKTALWPSDTFVEFDYSLNTAVNRLRRTLNDSAENPRFIETIPRQGYRFIAPVARALARPVAAHPELLPAPLLPRAVEPAFEPAKIPIRRRPALWMITTALVLASLVMIAVILDQKRDLPWGSGTVSEVVARPFSALPGTESRPAFAPDGSSVAFDWQAPDLKFHDIYVKRVDSDSTIRITRGSGDKVAPAWSPDGMQIAYLHDLGNGRCRIVSIPAAGGVDKGWAEITMPSIPHLDWSPDGEFFAVTDRASADAPSAIVLIWLRTGEKVWLTKPAPGQNDSYAAISRDSASIAFRRTLMPSIEDVFVAPVRKATIPDNELRRITTDKCGTYGHAWTSDGRALMISTQRAGSQSTLWRFPVSGGKPTLLSQAGWNVQSPAIARRGGGIVWLNVFDQWNIWRLAADGHSPAVNLISHTGLNSGPQLSPDGSRLAFRSNRTGTDEIWVSNHNGSEQRRLTSFNGPLTGSARWSPDGQRLAFESRVSGKGKIFVQSIYGQEPRMLMNSEANDVLPSWSRDGEWIYFTSDRNHGWQIWKVPAAGGTAVPVTTNGGFASFESPDGAFLYYAKRSPARGIWRVPVTGGQEHLVADNSVEMWGNWAITNKGLYYIGHPPRGGADEWAILWVDPESGKTRTLAPLSGLPARWDSGLSASVDGELLFYAQLGNHAADLMMLENSL